MYQNSPLKRSTVNRLFATAGVLCGIAVCIAPSPCLAQDSPIYPYTFEAGGGFGPVAGADGSNEGLGKQFLVGAGIWLNNQPHQVKDKGVNQYVANRTSYFLNCQFMLIEAEITQSALNQAILLNPQNTALLSATSAKSKYFTANFGPSVRFVESQHLKLSGYVFGGLGWLRREVDFTGPSNQAAVIQSTSSGLFAPAANSAAFDAGAGQSVAIGKGLTIFVEARVIKGLAINKGTTLLPISAGVRW